MGWANWTDRGKMPGGLLHQTRSPCSGTTIDQSKSKSKALMIDHHPANYVRAIDENFK